MPVALWVFQNPATCWEVNSPGNQSEQELFWEQVSLHSSPSKRGGCRGRALPGHEVLAVWLCPQLEGTAPMRNTVFDLKLRGISQLLSWSWWHTWHAIRCVPGHFKSPLEAGYRCTIDAPRGQSTKRRAVPQMVVGLKAGLTLLSPSYISRAVLHEQAVAYFTPIAGAAVL